MQRARTIEEWMRDNERDAPYEQRLVRARIPARYHSMTWADYVDDAVTEDKEKLKDVLMYYSEEWPPETNEGLVLLGASGVGKTAGLALVACDLVKAGAFLRWTSFAELQQRKRNLIGMAQRAQESDDWSDHEKEELRLRWIEQDSDVLVLDDVGKEYRASSDWSDTTLDLLLRSRTTAGKVTLLSSNLLYEQWMQYNSSMASFLLEMAEVVNIVKGVDHRFDSQPSRNRARRRARR